MRTSLALLVSLALATAGHAMAQDDGAQVNERTKTGRPVASAAPAPASDLKALAATAARLADAGDDLPEARRLLGNVRADARFDDQPQDFRHAVLVLAGYVEMREDQGESARSLLSAAAQLQDTDPDVWYWLSWVEADLGQHDDAARSLARLFRKWPDLGDNLQDDHLWRLVREADASSDARTELLQAIFDSGWKREALGGISHLHYELALVRARQGDVAALRRIVPTVTWPTDIVRMRSDRRFDGAVDGDNPAFDPEAAAGRLVTALQAQVRRHPGRLDIVVELQTALIVAGRFQEVITLAEDVQSAIAAAPADKPAYTDLDQLPWISNRHATALEGLGRVDESLARLEAASQLEENGVPNVSQALNLAHLYASLDRPDDALAAAARAGADMSDFGHMVKASTQQRAYLLKGDTEAAAKALAYLREHRSVSEPIYLEALVEAGDLDAAAAVVAALLSSQDERAEMLFKLQEFKQLPPLPGYARTEANWKALAARADVQAAVARVGRIVRVPLYRIE